MNCVLLISEVLRQIEFECISIIKNIEYILLHQPNTVLVHFIFMWCKPFINKKLSYVNQNLLLKKVYIDILEPPNLSDLEIFFKPLLSQCTLVCDEYMPHITGLIREVPFWGVKNGLHGLHRFTLVYMGLSPNETLHDHSNDYTHLQS